MSVNYRRWNLRREIFSLPSNKLLREDTQCEVDYSKAFDMIFVVNFAYFHFLSRRPGESGDYSWYSQHICLRVHRIIVISNDMLSKFTAFRRILKAHRQNKQIHKQNSEFFELDRIPVGLLLLFTTRIHITHPYAVFDSSFFISCFLYRQILPTECPSEDNLWLPGNMRNTNFTK